MALSKSSKGKKRALDVPSTTSPLAQEALSRKKPKRAETRPCPICDEAIPIRLLGRHAELESERVEDIIKHIGSEECLVSEFEEGSSTGARRSAALKARKSLSSITRAAESTTEQTGKMLQSIKRRRRQRHVKLKEMMRDEEDGNAVHGNTTRALAAGEISCPVCFSTIRGDNDVVEAHIDACLANESRRMQEQQAEELRERAQGETGGWDLEYEDGVVGHIGDVRGTGFHTRNQDEQDIEDEIDVDGEDHTFGAAQFTEGDILGPAPQPIIDESVEVDIEGDEDGAHEDQKTLRDLVAEGETGKRTGRESVGEETPPDTMTADLIRLEQEVQKARQHVDQRGLIEALENKIKYLTLTTNPQYPLGAGTRAVGVVGCGVLDPRSYVQSASA
ncbi:hypothetical protein AX16_000961 [Volvariella volvacea WC 439]|nr:hypothetical protein AX16_000961 [Volvariella volvacea WC 439]